jgi:hypothetical protein
MFTVAGLAAFAGVPCVAGVSAVAFIPAVAGFPAVDDVFAVASFSACPTHTRTPAAITCARQGLLCKNMKNRIKFFCPS